MYSKSLQYGFREANICVLIAEVSSAIVDAYHSRRLDGHHQHQQSQLYNSFLEDL